jgi:hypothetical protein
VCGHIDFQFVLVRFFHLSFASESYRCMIALEHVGVHVSSCIVVTLYPSSLSTSRVYVACLSDSRTIPWLRLWSQWQLKSLSDPSKGDATTFVQLQRRLFQSKEGLEGFCKPVSRKQLRHSHRPPCFLLIRYLQEPRSFREHPCFHWYPLPKGIQD